MGMGKHLKPGKAILDVIGVPTTSKELNAVLKNYKYNKEIEKLHNNILEQNKQNRGVKIIQSNNNQLSHQRLLITNGQEDTLNYVTASSNHPALDYIWGSDNNPEGTIVSGGDSKIRVHALIPFVRKAQLQNIPIVVLHNGNTDLEKMIQANSIGIELVDKNNLYYNVFRAMTIEDISFLLYKTMSTDNNTNPLVERLFHALASVILFKGDDITIENLAQFPPHQIPSELNSLLNNGSITQDEYNQILYYYNASATETHNVSVFLNQLNRQVKTLYGTPTPNNNSSNIRRMLNQKGIVAINVGNNNNNKYVVSLVINHLTLLHSEERNFAIVLDNITLSHYPIISDFLSGKIYAISHDDFISLVHQDGNDLFSEIMRNVSSLILFRHTSGSSCQKWSEYLGDYRRTLINYNINQSQSYLSTQGNTKGITTTEEDEPRVKAETINQLPSDFACIYNSDGILFSKV